MKISDLPDRFPIPFAAQAGGSYITYPVPTDSQIGLQPGRASLTDGFVPLNFQAVAAGGIPPYGEDFNGLLKQITLGVQWSQAGGPAVFDATFAAAIGGYMKGSVLQSAATVGTFWLSTADNNTTDPDGATPTNWIALNASGISLLSFKTGANVTYAAADCGRMVRRGNSGAAMIDTLPGTTDPGGVLPAGYMLYIQNVDATALLAIKPGTGTSITHSGYGFILLGPQQGCVIYSTGANYIVASAPARAQLGTAGINLYVSASGNDSNCGLTLGAAVATIQKAADYAANLLDFNSQQVTINVSDGAYSAGVSINGALVGANAIQPLVFKGNSATPANVVVTDSATCFAIAGANVTIDGFKVISTGNNGVGVTYKGSATIQNMQFGACLFNQIAVGGGGQVIVNGSYAVVAGALNHYSANSGGQISWNNNAITVTVTGTPAFSGQFAGATNGGQIVTPTTYGGFTGAATGQRYNAASQGLINTTSGGANFFPGNSAGATGGGGQYL